MTTSGDATRPTIPDLMRRLAGTHGALPQIQDQAGPLTFTEGQQRSAAMARGLLASGVGKGEKVGILMPNGAGWVTAWLAITRIGAVAVLLSTFAKPRELAGLLRQADVRTLLACDSFLKADFVSRLEAALPGLADQDGARGLRLPSAPYLRAIWTSSTPAPSWAAGDYASLPAVPGADAFDDAMLDAVEREVTPADPALLIFTSGTTAEPKAVVHTHGSVTRHAQAMAGYMTYEPGDRCLTTQPLFWVGGLCTSLLAANIRGASLLCPATPAPADMLRALRDDGATHIALWPAQIAALRDLPEFSDEDLRRLKPNSAQQLGLFGLAEPSRTPNSLGMSETFGPHSMEFPPAPLPANRAGSFGRAVAGLERKVIDPVSGRTLGPGEEGEICVRGYSMMAGFYKRERAEVFEPDGFLRTGDFGTISDDGFLFFTGRRNEMIKTSGANVAPREVELVLTSLPGVLEAAVVGLDDARLGQIVVAAVTPQTGALLDEDVLKALLREQLSDYKTPKRIVVLDSAEVPRTDSAKVQKVQLARLLAERLAETVG